MKTPYILNRGTYFIIVLFLLFLQTNPYYTTYAQNITNDDWLDYSDPQTGIRFRYPSVYQVYPGEYFDSRHSAWVITLYNTADPNIFFNLTFQVNEKQRSILENSLTNGYGWDSCSYCVRPNEDQIINVSNKTSISNYPNLEETTILYELNENLINTIIFNSENQDSALGIINSIEVPTTVSNFLSYPHENQADLNSLDNTLSADSFNYPYENYRYFVGYGVKNSNLAGITACYGRPYSELYHAGEDWGNNPGTAVNAVANGKVVYIHPTTTYPGRVIVVEHTLPDSVTYSMYGHLKNVNIVLNQNVQKGDKLAEVIEWPGDVGNSHLHFEIRDWATTSYVCPSNNSIVAPGAGYTFPDFPDNRGYKNPSKFIKDHLTTTPPPQPPTPPPSTLQGTKNISVPIRWYFSVSTGDPRIQNVYLDGIKIFNKPACAKYLWISRGNHIISFDYENSGSGVPEVNLSYWPFAFAACAADNFETPPDSPVPTPSIPVPLTDNAAILSDVTIPDGSILSPGQSLTKTWRMKNTGSTTWGSGYQLVFLHGDRMGAPASTNVPSTEPGQNVDFSVSITSPSSPGRYTGYWRLRNPQGTYFGPEIWVSLEVATQGSHITIFSADPPPPSNTTSVRIRARVENFSNFRALRMKVGNQVICEETTLEATCSWNTAGYAAGSHNIMVEVADQTDTSWSRSEKRSMVYTLTGTGASSNHIPNRPSLVANPVYDWYVYYSGNTAQLCAQPNGDSDGDAITGYYFEVTGAESWNSGWIGSSCVTTGGLGPHTYAFRAKVRDSRGGESDWSDSWHFTLVNPTLSITQLDFQPLDSSSEQVRIRACTAGQGGIGITMKVMVNEANDGSGNGKWNTIYELGVPCFNDTDAPTWHTLKYSDGTHRVRVEAHGLNTGWDGAAVLERTYTLPHRRPSGSDLYAPVPKSRDSNEAIYLNNQTITFKWENVLRNNNYTLFVSTTTNPQTDPNPVLNQTVGTNVTEYTAPFNQEYPILYWQVLSNGDAGASSSNIQKFGIDRTSPSCTVQTLEPTVFDNAFKVTWQGTDDVAGVASYDIQYLDSNRSEWVDWQTNQPASKTFDMFAGQPGHSYSFRCRSMDAAGNQSTYPSSPDTFTKIDPTTRPPEPWWNSAYAYKRSLIILNNDSDWMPPHFPVRIHFDGSTTPTASEIYNASSSAVKGNDVRIIYQNQTELNRIVQRFSSSQIDIWLPLQSGLGSGASDSTNYQIYYGNASAGSPPADAGAVFSPEADANTVGLWHFQEGGGSTSLDSSGRNHNGNYNNVGWVDGPTGWAVSFSGTSSSVKIPHTGDFNTNAMTIEAWIYVSYFDGTEWPIVWKSVPYTPGGFEFRFNHDRGIVFIPDLTSGRWDVQAGPIEAGRWYHVAGTFNGSDQGCIYINGIQSGCRTFSSGSQRHNSGEIRVGLSWEGSGDKSLPGYVQHVRLSNIARTDFPYARIDTQPSVAVGIQQTPAVEGEADLAVISLNTYPHSSGGVLVEAVVKNQGTISTTNGFYTDLYINHLPSGAGDYTGSFQFWVNDPIPAGGTTTLTTIISDLSQLDPLSTALAPGEEKVSILYVQADSTGSLTEADKANNIYPSAIVNLQIPIVADDYDSFEDETIFNLSGDSSHNNWIGTSPKVMSGWVFKDVSIPRGATILGAKLYLRGYGMDGTATARLYGFAEDDAQPFTINGANKPSLRPLTNSFVDWSNTWPFAWTVFESPDVSGIIQELVNRPGWTTSNNLGIRASNPSGVGTNWAVVDYAGGEGHSVTLEVSYLDPSIEGSAQICIAENDIYEQDNTYQSAQEIDRQQVHNFNKPNDEDWVKLFAKQGQTHKIQTSNLGPNSDTYLYLYGPDGTTLLASNDDYSGSLASQIEWTAPSDGTYYIQIKQWNPSLGGCGTGYTIGTSGVQPAIYLPLVVR